METFVKALEISINKDFFGEEHKDLIPYAVEHEIYEAWLWAKRGFQHPKASRVNHLLARKRQMEMAMRDGKAEKFLDFYLDVNPEFASELEYAYQRAKEKYQRQNEKK